MAKAGWIKDIAGQTLDFGVNQQAVADGATGWKVYAVAMLFKAGPATVGAFLAILGLAYISDQFLIRAEQDQLARSNAQSALVTTLEHAAKDNRQLVKEQIKVNAELASATQVLTQVAREQKVISAETLAMLRSFNQDVSTDHHDMLRIIRYISTTLQGSSGKPFGMQ